MSIYINIFPSSLDPRCDQKCAGAEDPLRGTHTEGWQQRVQGLLFEDERRDGLGMAGLGCHERKDK